MPELPEVETVVRSLRPGLIGRTITRARFGRVTLRRSGPTVWGRQVGGRTMTEITRRGKWIIIALDAGALLVHLGMTGQLTLLPREAARARHTHVVIDLDGPLQLRYRDERRFGSVTHFTELTALHDFLNTKLGPEPFALKPAAWRETLAHTRRCIKAVLLDQAVVAGVGNIYADEALFGAKIHPGTAADRLERTRADALRRTLSRVLEFAIECRGSSIRNYLDGVGERGGYQEEFRVYGRTGAPCRRCRGPIARVWLAGRSTHFCPRCQPSHQGPTGRARRTKRTG